MSYCKHSTIFTTRKLNQNKMKQSEQNMKTITHQQQLFRSTKTAIRAHPWSAACRKKATKPHTTHNSSTNERDGWWIIVKILRTTFKAGLSSKMDLISAEWSTHQSTRLTRIFSVQFVKVRNFRLLNFLLKLSWVCTLSLEVVNAPVDCDNNPECG